MGGRDNFLNPTFSNLPSVQAMEETGLLEVSAGAGRRQSSARSCVCDAQLGKDDCRFSEREQPDLRKTYRHGQLGHVLFRLG
jgi:hypothetical protein